MESNIKKVDFFVAGVQKSGTTSLDQYLRQHPDIEMPKNNYKELHFFDENIEKGVAYYHAYFTESKKGRVRGECTPIYLYWQSVLEDIVKYNNNAKIIVTLRNPIERAYSHWNMEYTHKREHLPFIDALTSESFRLSRSENLQHRVYSYLDRGAYYRQIKNLWNIFEKNKTLILKSDDLFNYPNKTLNKVFIFLGITPLRIEKKLKLYSGTYHSAMSKEAYHFLSDHFHDEIKNIESLLEWDCSSWKVK